MLFRDDGEDVIAITQPSHSWLSGQLLRAWGNQQFAIPSPREEVCLAAAIHDIGWLAWEAAPSFDPVTGRPHDFLKVGPAVHTRLWTDGVRYALCFGRYPALLVSLHANTLYENFFDFQKAPATDSEIVRSFLTTQMTFQHETITTITQDPRYSGDATPEEVDHNRLLIAAADYLSLKICWGISSAARVPKVPAAQRSFVELDVSAPSRDRGDLIVHPWPFASDEVTLICEGYRMRERFVDETTMRRALAASQGRTTLTTRLRPR